MPRGGEGAAAGACAGGWACEACTFHNPPHAAACDVCGGAAPPGTRLAPADDGVEFRDPDGDAIRFFRGPAGELRYSVGGGWRDPFSAGTALDPALLLRASRGGVESVDGGVLEFKHPHLHCRLRGHTDGTGGTRNVCLPTPYAHLLPALRALCAACGVACDLGRAQQPGVCGLANLGNTCFMNGALQLLASTPALADHFVCSSVSGVNESNPIGYGGKIAREFASLMRDMWSGSFSDVEPAAFRAAFIDRVSDRFAGCSQHDTQEFLSAVLDALHEDLNSRGGGTTPPAAAAAGGAEPEAEARQAERAWQRHLRRNSSPVDDAFAFQLRSQVTCLGCGFVSLTFDPARMLACPIPPTPGPCLADCLRLHNREEVLEGGEMWRCPRCEAPRRARKVMALMRAPAYLAVSLKRFSKGGAGGEAAKLATPVAYPLRGLSLAAYAAPGAAVPADETYDLYAVALHDGTIASGHVTALARNSDDMRWRHYDDARVTEVGDDAARSHRDAYVLLYRRGAAAARPPAGTTAQLNRGGDPAPAQPPAELHHDCAAAPPPAGTLPADPAPAPSSAQKAPNPFQVPSPSPFRVVLRGIASAFGRRSRPQPAAEEGAQQPPQQVGYAGGGGGGAVAATPPPQQQR